MMENKILPLYEKVGGFQCLLELGKWTPNSIDSLLLDAHQYGDSSERLHWIVKHFIGVRFEFESMSQSLPRGILRVRLESMDCITYIYNMLALCNAKNFNEYVFNLYNIRYLATDCRYIDSDPDTGNILDFAEESLLLNGVNTGYLSDITDILVSSDALVQIDVNIRRFQRNAIQDANTCYVTPRFGDRVVSSHFIPVELIESIDKTKIKSGDIILFSEGHITKHGVTSPVLISHLAIAHIENNEIYFYHSTRHFYWRPDATSKTPGEYTGVFLDKDHQKEIIGTAHAGMFAGEETKTIHENFTYFGLNQKIKRPLVDFASRLFKGIKVLRVRSG